MGKKVSKEVGLKLYELMVRIRKFEEAVVNLYARGKIPGFLHTYIGEEAVAAGVCANLTGEDKITSTHRGHGHMVAKGGRFDKAMGDVADNSNAQSTALNKVAELLGRNSEALEKQLARQNRRFAWLVGLAVVVGLAVIGGLTAVVLLLRQG